MFFHPVPEYRRTPRTPTTEPDTDVHKLTLIPSFLLIRLSYASPCA